MEKGFYIQIRLVGLKLVIDLVFNLWRFRPRVDGTFRKRISGLINIIYLFYKLIDYLLHNESKLYSSVFTQGIT